MQNGYPGLQNVCFVCSALLFDTAFYLLSLSSGTTVAAAENVAMARKACLAFLETKLRRITKLDKKIREALRVYDTGLIRESRWGDDFFGIEPFYIMAGE